MPRLKARNDILAPVLLPASILLMWAGLLWSRLGLSLGMMLFFGLALLARPIGVYWRAFRHEPVSGFMAVLFLIPLVTGAWSEDRATWLAIMQMKLPLLLLPFFSPVLSLIPRRPLTLLLAGMVLLLVMACMISLLPYFADAAGMASSYLRASVIPVAMDNDHVRFGWVLAIAWLFLMHVLFSGQCPISRNTKWAVIAVLVFLAVYVHLLASRTGLLGFYLVNLLLAVGYLSRKGRTALLATLCLLPLLAWALFPTFRNRLRFMHWDYQNYSRSGYTEGLSDAPRLISLRAGRDLLRNHPLRGTGFGDLRAGMEAWYDSRAPYLKAYERLLPSNEWLLHGAAAGIFGMLAFLFAVSGPLFIRTGPYRWLWRGFHLLALSGFVYEIGLETQYGVFLYAFFSSWIRVLALDPRPGQG